MEHVAQKDNQDVDRWERFVPPPPNKRGRKPSRHKDKTKYKKKHLGVRIIETDES